MLTADTPIAPKREYNIRNGFGIPLVPSLVGGFDVATHPRWAWRVLLRYIRERGMPVYANYPEGYRQTITRGIASEPLKLAERLTWDDVAELRNRWCQRRSKIASSGRSKIAARATLDAA